MSTVYQRSIHVGLVAVSFTSLGGFGRTEIEKNKKSFRNWFIKSFFKNKLCLMAKIQKGKIKSKSTAMMVN